MAPKPWRYRAGVNTVGGYANADALKAAGFSLIRLPFTWERLQPTEGAELRWQSVDSAVRTLSDLGFRIILDFHQSQWSDAFFANAAGLPKWLYPDADGATDRERGGHDVAKAAFLRNEHSFGYTGTRKPWAMWGDVLEACAQRYAAEPAVLGIDLANELGWGGDAMADVAPSQLRLFYERMGRRVAEQAPDWWLVCENGTWSNIERHEAPFQGADEWPELENLVCSAHFYPSVGAKRKGETEVQAAGRMIDLLDQQFAMAESLGVPFYLGEFAAFGASSTAGKADALHWPQWPTHTRVLAQWLKANGVAWTYWAWQQGAGPTLTDDHGGLRRDILDALAPALR
jgi:hypothetical protein